MFRNFIRSLMIGRYGTDHLSIAMIVVSLVLNLLQAVILFAPILYISYALIALAIFRVMSRNIAKRRAENDKFIRFWWPVRTKMSRKFANIKHRRTHKFLKCPGCSNTLRVPKGKGKIQITCPKCGERFVKTT